MTVSGCFTDILCADDVDGLKNPLVWTERHIACGVKDEAGIVEGFLQRIATENAALNNAHI